MKAKTDPKLKQRVHELRQELPRRVTDAQIRAAALWLLAKVCDPDRNGRGLTLCIQHGMSGMDLPGGAETFDEILSEMQADFDSEE